VTRCSTSSALSGRRKRRQRPRLWPLPPEGVPVQPLDGMRSYPTTRLRGHFTLGSERSRSCNRMACNRRPRCLRSPQRHAYITVSDTSRGPSGRRTLWNVRGTSVTIVWRRAVAAADERGRTVERWRVLVRPKRTEARRRIPVERSWQFGDHRLATGLGLGGRVLWTVRDSADAVSDTGHGRGGLVLAVVRAELGSPA
jgi:hypothetical protein